MLGVLEQSGCHLVVCHVRPLTVIYFVLQKKKKKKMQMSYFLVDSEVREAADGWLHPIPVGQHRSQDRGCQCRFPVVGDAHRGRNNAGVIHLLQGGHGPGVSGCTLSTNRYISGLDRPGWFWPRIPLPTLRLLESQVSEHGLLLDFVGGEPRTLWPVNSLSLFRAIVISFLVIVTKCLT